MRGMKALLAAVIIMGIAILLGTGVLVATVVHRALRPTHVGAVALGTHAAVLTLGEPAGTRIISAVRLSDTALAVTLSGGSDADRLVIWDLSRGQVAAALRLHP